MLIIERKITQGFYVGEAYVKVLPGSTKSRIRLGIEAPRDVAIIREELLEKPGDNAPGDNHPIIPGPWPQEKKRPRPRRAA